jgi:hypothetical protein
MEICKPWIQEDTYNYSLWQLHPFEDGSSEYRVLLIWLAVQYPAKACRDFRSYVQKLENWFLQPFGYSPPYSTEESRGKATGWNYGAEASCIAGEFSRNFQELKNNFSVMFFFRDLLHIFFFWEQDSAWQYKIMHLLTLFFYSGHIKYIKLSFRQSMIYFHRGIILFHFALEISKRGLFKLLYKFLLKK